MLDQIRQNASSWAVKVAFGIIILVFVFWGVSGNNDSGPGTVATVNGHPILMQDFQRALMVEQENMRAQFPNLSQDDVKQFHLPEQVLSRLVARELLTLEAKKLGITVTPREYAAYVRSVPQFQKDGVFDQKQYEDFVAMQRRQIGEYEQDFMRQMVLEKMYGTISSAVAVSATEARQRLGFEMEKRVISYVLFPTEEYRDGITITDEAINAYYNSNQARFAYPATVALSYIEVTPASIAHTMDVPGEDVENAFNAGPLRYNTRQIHIPVPEDADAATVTAVTLDLEKVGKELADGKDLAEATKDLVTRYPDLKMGDSGMLDAKRMPPEMLTALAGLGVNAVAPVIRIDQTMVLAQLLATEPDWTQPEAAIKDALLQELSERKAFIAFRDVQVQAEDMLALGTPLEKIAEELQLVIKTTERLPKDELQYALNLRTPSQLSLIDGPAGTVVSGLLETQDGFLLAAILESEPAGVQPLETVQDVVRDVLVLREAEKKAEEAARAALPQFATGTPEAFADKIVTTEPFSRTGSIEALGYSKHLIDAVFAAPTDAWVQEPFATPKGAVLAMPVEIIAMNDTDWAKIEPQAIGLILQSKQGQLMNAFLSDLHKKATIKVVAPELFE